MKFMKSLVSALALLCVAGVADAQAADKQYYQWGAGINLSDISAGAGTLYAPSMVSVDTSGVPVSTRNSGYLDSTASLGISATFNGTARTAPSWASYFQCRGYADQTGTIQIQQSEDSGSTWYNASATAAITGSGNPAAFVRVSITGVAATTRFRCVEVNSTTAQTLNRLTSAFTAN